MKRYAIRYSMEAWGKPVPVSDQGGLKPSPGVTISKSDYGYTDRLFAVSFVKNKDGSESVLMLDSIDGPDLTRELLEEVRDQINHYLEHHCVR